LFATIFVARNERDSFQESTESPRNVSFIDGSAFDGMKSNCAFYYLDCERFVIENEFEMLGGDDSALHVPFDGELGALCQLPPRSEKINVP
jgi:hypothetical protein